MVTEKTDKKDIILDAAEKLFSEMGYEGASTRLIATEANVNMAMLNYYFGSKQGLMQSVLERRLGGFRQILSDLNEEDISSWDKLYRCIDMYAERIMSNNCFQRIMHRELSVSQRSEMTDFLSDSVLKNTSQVKRIITEGIENGTFRNVDVDLTVASIFGTKYYLINNSQIASRLLEKDLTDEQVMQNEMKPRLKKHLHDFLTALLTKHDTQA